MNIFESPKQNAIAEAVAYRASAARTAGVMPFLTLRGQEQARNEIAHDLGEASRLEAIASKASDTISDNYLLHIGGKWI